MRPINLTHKKSLLIGIGILICLMLVFGLNIYAEPDASKPPHLRTDSISYLYLVLLNVSIFLFFVTVALLLSKRIQRILVPTIEEKYLSDLLQFLDVMNDDKTIRTKDGKLFQTISLDGMDYTSFTKDEVLHIFRRRESFLVGLLRDGVGFRIITCRDILSEKDHFSFAHPILNKIHGLWNSQFDRSFKNKYYIVLHIDGKKLNALRDLHSIAERVMDHFERYNPVLLLNKTSYGSVFSPLLGFWSKMVNRFDFGHVVRSKDLSVMLSQAAIEFNEEIGLITYSDGQCQIFEKVMMVKIWGEKDFPFFLLELLKLDGEIIIQHLVEGVETDKALRHLVRGANLSVSLDGTSEKMAEFDHVKDLVRNDEASVAFHQMSVYIRAKSKEELNDLCDQARRILVFYGMTPSIEQGGLRYVWLSQFPGFEKKLRKRTFLSSNIANFMNFDKFSTGFLSSDWGAGPVRQFKTVAGNSYAFQFHVSDSKESTGHCVVFAPTEGGKTTLMQHLIGGAMRHEDLKVFAFDKLNGMSIFTRALDGNHIHFGEEKKNIALNPFHAEDTPAYRSFLFRWLCDLTRLNPEDEASRAQVNCLIDMAFDLSDQRDRSLTDLWESAVVRNNDFHKRLKEWTGDHISSRWFNGETDVLDFSKSNLVTFDMTDILEDEAVAGPVINYIMYRIRSYCQASALPHLIFIDETKRYIANDLFRKDLTTLLEEHRKLRGVVCLAFQNTQSIGDPQFQESVLNQCKTRIIFPNPNAKKEEYQSLDLTEGEFAFIKGDSEIAKKMKRGVLVKRPTESVILDVDLGNLGPYLNLYKSGSEPVKLVKNLHKKWGNQWISKYLEG